MKILKALKHDNIVHLKEIVTSKGELHRPQHVTMICYVGRFVCFSGKQWRIHLFVHFHSYLFHWMFFAQFYPPILNCMTLFRISQFVIFSLSLSEETSCYIHISNSHTKLLSCLFFHSSQMTRSWRYPQKCLHGIRISRIRPYRYHRNERN